MCPYVVQKKRKVCKENHTKALCFLMCTYVVKKKSPAL